MSMMSSRWVDFGGGRRDAIGVGGSAVTSGVKLPLDVFEPTVLKPSTISKSSSAVISDDDERGKSSLATSVARAMKVERGKVMPRFDCKRL